MFRNCGSRSFVSGNVGLGVCANVLTCSIQTDKVTLLDGRDTALTLGVEPTIIVSESSLTVVVGIQYYYSFIPFTSIRLYRFSFFD